ncbi:potassium channel family protein [Nakamurella leprariae]|uniref:Ion transporter n=1 Tax=Nakamurella leprariae TaxID=2803911 RepID=A0A938Y9K0_9ACTN|nr:potassium channel family protein [Nakamurella leprariae]MBM9466457.1 ion transporter [Nakamurella leprariae]
MDAARWHRLAEWPLMAAALAFLAAWSWQVIGDLHGTQETVAAVVVWVAWVVFAVDYAGRLLLAHQRGRWFLHHLLDLAVVALPLLRPLRVLRLVVLLGVFQRFAGRTLRGRVIVYVAGCTVGLIHLCALAMLDAERGRPDATINTFGDAIWWAFTTITTVGYGDRAPVTVTGRCVAVVLMIGGVALLGTVTATIASWIVERVAQEDEAEQAATRRQVDELTREIRAVQRPVVGPGPTAQPIRAPRDRRLPGARSAVPRARAISPGRPPRDPRRSASASSTWPA